MFQPHWTGENMKSLLVFIMGVTLGAIVDIHFHLSPLGMVISFVGGVLAASI